jgi:hypothetical protein
MNDNHPVADFPPGHRALDQFYQSMRDVGKTVQTSLEIIKESQQLLVRLDRLIGPLIEQEVSLCGPRPEAVMIK